MALGISELVNNISDSIGGFLNDTGLLPNGSPADGSPVYPRGTEDYAFLQNNFDDKGMFRKLLIPYAFEIIDVKNPIAENLEFGEFELPLAPQSIDQEEDMAISIKPTQGGTTVTHSGTRYKTLLIKGTTGIAPFRGAGGVDRQTGEAILQPKKLKYKSGYEVFHHLRNYFRTYYEYKKVNGDLAANLRLLFKNYKDGEFLIVELLKFKMTRQAGKPFLYDYDLQFKVIAHYRLAVSTEAQGFLAQTDALLENANRILDISRGVMLRSQDILRQIESTYSAAVLEPLRKISLILKYAKAIPLVAADIGSRTIKSTMRELDALSVMSYVQSVQDAAKTVIDGDIRLLNAILPTNLEDAIATSGVSVISDLGEALVALDLSLFPEATRDAVIAEQAALINTPRSFFTEALQDLTRVKANLEDFIGLGSPELDVIFDRTATLNADPTKILTDSEYDLLYAFSQAKKAIQTMLSSDRLFKSNFDTRIQDIVTRFNDQIDLQANPSVTQVTLNSGDTLPRLALKYLGDSTRWGEIVEANNLRPPYITGDLSSTSSNVLRTGDKILIPQPQRNGFSQAPKGAENKLIKGLTELERSMGVDFKVDKNFDLILSNSGDLELVAGTDNLAQAVIIKLSYERGDVIRHPTMGVGLNPGSKFPALQKIKDDLVRTLLQDSRIERVSGLSLVQENSALSISLTIKVKQIDIPIPIKIKV